MKYSKIIIVTYSFFDFEKQAPGIGGLETYVKDLLGLSDVLNCSITVYQLTTNRTERKVCFLGANIIEFTYGNSTSVQDAFDKIYNSENNGFSFFIISAEIMNIKSPYGNVATIQHGIYIDAPDEFLFKNSKIHSPILRRAYRYYRCYRETSRFLNIHNLICVDYNYFNWFRTLANIPEDYSVRIIPNHISNCISVEELEQKFKVDNPVKRIVFARRFVDFRGTLLLVNVAKRLLESRHDIDITFAGDGPLRGMIENELSNYGAFHITSFVSTESISFHKQFDISIVPSIYSEGTSLSLLEAMASGCFPIASHVGGMTNIILDGYNGKLFYPNEAELYKTLIEVLALPIHVFNEIRRNAYLSCISAFGKEKWLKEWANFILTAE